MSARNFLQDYTALYKSTEIPERFTLWCGLAGVSAMLSRKVWMNMGTYTIYPNMYIVLVASPGQSRKSAAVSNMEKLLTLAEPSPNLVGNEMTTQGLFDALQEVETDDSSNFLKKTSIGYATVDELVNFLNKKSYEQGLGHFLLKLYDCPPIYESITRGKGKLSIKNACFGFLAGTTLPLLRRAIPSDAVGDGLTSRIIFIYNEKKGVPSLFTSLTEKQKEIKESLVKTLSKISRYNGEVQITDEAKEYADKRYNHLYYHSTFNTDPLLGGYASRRHNHLFSVAMCLAASEAVSKRLVLELKHITGADALLEEIEEFLPTVLTQIASNDKGDTKAQVYAFIQSLKTVTRAQILQQFDYKIDSQELAEIVRTLALAKKIEIKSNGQSIIYSILPS